jgi:hypothetical protein
MIDIEMKLVMALGEDRVQLECMCGHQFTFAPAERINTIGRGKRTKAKCPKCGTTWNGRIDDLSQATALPIRYFALYARLDNKEMNEKIGIHDKPDGCVRIGVGAAADMAHFALSAIARFCQQNEPIILIVKKIEKAEYDEARHSQLEKARAHIMMSSVGLFGMLLGGKPDEDDENPEGE